MMGMRSYYQNVETDSQQVLVLLYTHRTKKRIIILMMMMIHRILFLLGDRPSRKAFMCIFLSLTLWIAAAFTTTTTTTTTSLLGRSQQQQQLQPYAARSTNQHHRQSAPRINRVLTWGTSTRSSAEDSSLNKNNNNIVDVDFERVVVVEDAAADTEASPPWDNTNDTKKKRKNLLELSLDADPRWKTARIPFCRSDDDEYIDAKLAFMVELEGVQYGIAVPYDDAVAIIVQEREGKKVSVSYVDPDAYHENEEYQELMEIMAAQVQNELGEELQLRKTPKVLTISGGLSRLISNADDNDDDSDDSGGGEWKRELFGKPALMKDFVEITQKTTDETIDDEIAEFMAFMKEELGEEEFEKTLNEELSQEDLEMMKYFSVPGLGDKKEDVAAWEELVNSMQDDLDETKGVTAEVKAMAPDTDGLALKLISFEFKSGDKSYSLVKLLTPYVLVGRYCADEASISSSSTTEGDSGGDIRFELLTKEEERILIPQLESVCQADLAKAGLSLVPAVGEDKHGRTND